MLLAVRHESQEPAKGPTLNKARAQDRAHLGLKL